MAYLNEGLIIEALIILKIQVSLICLIQFTLFTFHKSCREYSLMRCGDRLGYILTTTFTVVIQ
jgi:hypothetical protein